MSSNAKFKLNKQGVRELMCSDAMANIISAKANQVQAAAGDGYEASVVTGKTRVNAKIGTAIIEAIRDNHKNNTLLKALGGAR